MATRYKHGYKYGLLREFAQIFSLISCLAECLGTFCQDILNLFVFICQTKMYYVSEKCFAAWENSNKKMKVKF